MKVFIASDHAGFALKNTLAEYLRTEQYYVEDLGPFTYIESDDYPDYITPLAERVGAEHGSFGIALGGSGEGEAMAANRVEGVRAAEYYGGNKEIVHLAREHNDANILSLGARFISEEEAKEVALLFLRTSFSGEERHQRRIEKLDN